MPCWFKYTTHKYFEEKSNYIKQLYIYIYIIVILNKYVKDLLNYDGLWFDK